MSRETAPGSAGPRVSDAELATAINEMERADLVIHGIAINRPKEPEVVLRVHSMAIDLRDARAELATLRNEAESLLAAAERVAALEAAVELAIGFAVAFRQDHGEEALRYPEVGILFVKMTEAREAALRAENGGGA